MGLRGIKKAEKGVSPVVATILLIAIVVVAVGAIAAFVLGRPMTPHPIAASISVSGAYKHSTTLTLEHTGGDPIRNAFVENSDDDNVITSENWINMEVRINGAKVTAMNCKLNRVGIPSSSDFEVGDILVFNISEALSSGDEVTISYTPANQILASASVP